MDKLGKLPELRLINWQLVSGIGVDATGSTPIPVTESLQPISELTEFKSNLNAKAWMWKDHTSGEEAQLITQKATESRPKYLDYCGGSYSSEWFWAKVLHCLHVDKAVFDAAASWIEFSDYVPAVLSGIKSIKDVKRNSCAAGHKALFNHKWGGYPDADFIGNLHPELSKVLNTMPQSTHNINDIAGYLSSEWAQKFDLKAEIPIAMGALDAHVGASGSGVNENTLVKVIGTSTCDIITGCDGNATIAGVSGIANDSVIPGYLGIEAGQSAVGDIFKWYVEGVLNRSGSSHQELSEKAMSLLPGESGLLALDWNNGNRDVLSDPNLRGLLIGQSLYTKDYEIYRALIEATAFGAKRIIDQLEKSGVQIDQIICCGGIPQKNKLFMQIYADVLNRPVFIAKSNETVALGAAMVGGGVALSQAGESVALTELQQQFCHVCETKYQPTTEHVVVYKELYKLYLQLHDAFGLVGHKQSIYNIMKQLIQLKNDL